MNVLILNEQQNKLQNLEIDIIKSVTGVFEATEIIEMFKDFYYNKIILDVTALKGYDMPITYKTLADGISPDKVIFYLKEGSELCTSLFLSRIIDYGIYNFTTNIDGVKYLVNHSNTYKDVEHIKKMADKSNKEYDTNTNTNTNNFIKATAFSNDRNGPIIIGFKNITTNAGSTSLIYMLKKELTQVYGNKVVAIEVDKTDFLSFGDKQMISTTSDELEKLVGKLSQLSIILIDLNECTVKNLCSTTIYLIEPSIIKINTLMRRNKTIINSLKDKKVILNKSLLSQKEVSEFEYESNINILYNMPPLNDRKRNAIILDFLKKIRLIDDDGSSTNTNKIFGLFRK